MAENTTLPPAGTPAYDPSMDARVSILEHIVLSIDKTLGDIRQDLREMRQDLADIRRDQKSDTRWLLGLGLAATAFLLAADAGLFALMAHGFHWL
jgi:hypothetical protein